MNYDTSKREFNIYSEQISLIGLRQLTIKAHLTQYPVIVTSKPESASIDIIDPCIDPDGIIPEIQ